MRKTFQSEGYDLTPEQWGVLTRLREGEGLNQSQLGEKTFKDRHNITRILNLLENRGCIERRADKTDRRIYRLFFNKTGQDLQEKLNLIVMTRREAVFEGLSREDIQTMQRIVEHMVKNVERRFEAMGRIKEDGQWRGKIG
ncbi:MAG: MarR family transcriptional regulator [Deltaproteobacteria bacterium]|nr:MarR family transcriptional regulator [Deltaproteobacteria bacterium]